MSININENNSDEKIILLNLYDYSWDYLLDSDLFKIDVIDLLNEKENKNKDSNFIVKDCMEKKKCVSFLKEKYPNFFDIIDDEKLNKTIFTDYQYGRGFRFNINNTFLSGNNNEKKFINNLEEKLKNLIEYDKDIIKKIKITSSQVIHKFIYVKLYKYFNCEIIQESGLFYFSVKLRALESNKNDDKYTTTKIYNNNNHIISTIESYYILRLINMENKNIYYDFCRINFNIIINFTMNEIKFKYKIIYENNFYKNIIKIFQKNINLNLEVQQKIYNLINKLLININIDNIKSKEKFNKIIELIYIYFDNICENIDNIEEYFNIFNSIITSDKNKEKSNFLIISYNEEGNFFTFKDCIPILFKILDENPSFIFVCTQKSLTPKAIQIKGKKTHYQYILNSFITKINYMRYKKKNASSKIKTLIFNQKDLRTRIFINKNNFNNSNKYNIINFNNEIKFESIFTKLEFSNNENIYKIIVINSYLPITKVNIDIIVKKFNLINYWKKEGYNIFFCGNMNNIFNKNNYSSYNLNNNLLLKFKLKNKLYKYIYNKSFYKLNDSSEYEYTKFKDEEKISKKNFYKLLPNFNYPDNEKIFYSKLIDSMDDYGIYKFLINNKDYLKKNPKMNIINDKIIFVLSENINININPNNYYIYSFPNKSDHKMISLSFDLCNYNCSKSDIIERNIPKNIY